jgi:molybdopterin biosynthesis enzyme MoaB
VYHLSSLLIQDSTMPPTPVQTLKAAILIVSDTASAVNSADKTGPLLEEIFTTNCNAGWEVVETKIIPDDSLEIQRAITGWADSNGDDVLMNCVVTSGGTGFARRDLTPEVSSAMVGKNRECRRSRRIQEKRKGRKIGADDV